MKTIKELEVLKKKGKRCVDFVDNTLKKVLGLIDEINTKSASGRERAPVLVLEELKAKIQG